MLDDKLPNKSIIKIEVHTKFKPQVEDGEDVRSEVIKAFHNAVFAKIEEYLTEMDSFEEDVLDELNHREVLSLGIDEFSDLGEVSIQICEEQPVEVKQEDLGEQELEDYFKLEKIKNDKNQKKLDGGFHG